MTRHQKRALFDNMRSLFGSSARAHDSAPPADEAGERLQVFQQRCIFVPTPPGWTYHQETGATVIVPTASVTHISNEVKIMVSIFPDANNVMETLTALTQAATYEWEHTSRTAVDKVLRLCTANNAHGKAVWHHYTDKALAGRPIPPNQWLHVTRVMRSRDGLMLQFTVLSNSLDSPDYLQGREIALTGVRELPRSAS